MRWYNPKRWFSLTTGIVLVGIIVFLVFIGMIIVGLSLWNVPLAKQIFPFLEISDVFPTKAIALFTGLATFGTLVLALTTILTIKNNNEREKRRREDELDKEKRSREESLLNEIIEWAEDVARLNFKIYNFVEAQISKESWVESSIGEIMSQFQVVEVKGVYINNIALSSFMKNKKLSKAVKAVNKEIRNLVDVSVERLDGKVATEAVTKHMNSLRLRITDLLEEAAKIKARDIG